MATQSNTNTSGKTVLIILLLVFTFPLWIGLLGGLIGLVAGLFGAAIGMIAGFFGAVIGLIGSLFGAVFGVFHIPFSGAPFMGFNFLLITCLVIALVMASRSRKRQ